LPDLDGAFAEDPLGEVELLDADDRLVGVGDGDVAEAFLAEVDPVGDDDLDGVRRPCLAGPGAQPVIVEDAGDGFGAAPLPRVQVVDASYGAGLDLGPR
jgi:hypothetical protein